MKTRIELYGPDILSAKRLPWALRDFIVDHGGVERVRTEIWSQCFNPEYLRQISQGTYGPEAVAKAHQYCDTMVWETAFQKGYVDKTERRRQAKKKTSCKKRTDTNKQVDISSKGISGKKSSLAKPFGDGINASVDLVVTDIWSDGRAISLLIAVARAFVYYRRIASELSVVKIIALEFPRRLAIEYPSSPTTLDVPIGSASFSDRTVLVHVRTLCFARESANDHLAPTKTFTMISSCQSAMDCLDLARAHGLQHMLAIAFQATASIQDLGFQRKLAIEYPAFSNQSNLGLPRQFDVENPAAVGACAMGYQNQLAKNCSKSVPYPSAFCTGCPNARGLGFTEHLVSSTTNSLPIRAIVPRRFGIGNNGALKIPSGTSMNMALFKRDIASAIPRADVKIPIMFTSLCLGDEIHYKRYPTSSGSAAKNQALLSKENNDDPCTDTTVTKTTDSPSTDNEKNFTLSHAERRVTSINKRNLSEINPEGMKNTESGVDEKATKYDISDDTALINNDVKTKSDIKLRKKKSLAKRFGRLFKACICGRKDKTACRE